MDLMEMANKIHWLGHDGFRVDASRTIYFDPYAVSSGKTADIVLITHEHYDHCSPDDIRRVSGEGTIIVTEADSAKKLKGDVRVIGPGASISLDGVRIQAVPAYNIGKKFHPKENGWLGFIVEVDGVRIYHAGDTDFIPEMKRFETDIALLPVSGTYVMNAEEAVEAALAIRPKLAIPMHYGAIVGDRSDADRFRDALLGKMDVVVLVPS